MKERFRKLVKTEVSRFALPRLKVSRFAVLSKLQIHGFRWKSQGL